jgi:hypothetical protein
MGLFANPLPGAFVLALPKAELHLHLEGAIEPVTLLEIQRSHGQKSATLADVEKLYQYADFSGFLTSFKNITEHLKTPADYELITYLRRPGARAGARPEGFWHLAALDLRCRAAVRIG